jgi:hypothetical protein
MQEEDYMTDRDLIVKHLKEFKEGFPSQREYHAQELRRVLPSELVEELRLEYHGWRKVSLPERRK